MKSSQKSSEKVQEKCSKGTLPLKKNPAFFGHGSTQPSRHRRTQAVTCSRRRSVFRPEFPAKVDIWLTAPGSVPLRLEIRELQNKHPDQWNLYLLGLDAFKKVDEKSDLSYYGIAGIHGRPYRPWGGVKGTNNPGWQGYCTHSSILFASWHRPYLALFEVCLHLPSEVFKHPPDMSIANPICNRTECRSSVPSRDKGKISTSSCNFQNSVLGLGCRTTKWRFILPQFSWSTYN